MANIIPFKAVRPTRDKVSLVAARSYQSYTEEQLESRLRVNPFSFLNIVNPASYNHLRAHETGKNLVSRLLLEKKKKNNK